MPLPFPKDVFEFNYIDKGLMPEDAPLQLGYGCWAEVGCAVAEAKYFKEGGSSVDTSPSVQQLIDCKHCYGSVMFGGYIEDAWFYMEHFGVANTSEYPKLTDGSLRGECRHCRQGPVRVIPRFTVDGYRSIPVDIDSIGEALLNEGPLAVFLLCGTRAWDYYDGGVTGSGGVYREMPSNPKIEVWKHYVVLVGYGRNVKRQKYWVLRNSAGPQWGDKGLMRLLMTKTNCFQKVLTPIRPRRFDVEARNEEEEEEEEEEKKNKKKRKRGCLNLKGGMKRMGGRWLWNANGGLMSKKSKKVVFDKGKILPDIDVFVISD